MSVFRSNPHLAVQVCLLLLMEWTILVKTCDIQYFVSLFVKKLYMFPLLKRCDPGECISFSYNLFVRMTVDDCSHMIVDFTLGETHFCVNEQINTDYISTRENLH